MIEVDTHVHTVLSGHAFSTLMENVAIAKKKGMKGFATTDHGPQVSHAAPNFLPYTMRLWPTHMEGIRVYKSCEANIVGSSGKLDIPTFYIKMLDFVLAGLHNVPEDSFGLVNATKAMVAAYNDPYVDVITHPDNPHYPCDLERVVMAAKANGKAIEINNQSIQLRPGAKENVAEMIRLCKENDTMVVASSDAHLCYNVGEVDVAERMLKDAGFPEELVLNKTFERFDAYVKARAERLAAMNDED
ncbi:MAG: PHP domain-containing protein [Eubacteriales bacterium]